MKTTYFCDAISTPIGRYSGSLSSVRTDDLGAIPIKTLVNRNLQVKWNEWHLPSDYRLVRARRKTKTLRPLRHVYRSWPKNYFGNRESVITPKTFRD